MGDLWDEWQSFWDIAAPQQAATAMASTYGEAARQAALPCVAAAEADGRAEDSRFWCAVARQLRGTTDGVPTTPAATEAPRRAGTAEPGPDAPADIGRAPGRARVCQDGSVREGPGSQKKK